MPATLTSQPGGKRTFSRPIGTVVSDTEIETYLSQMSSDALNARQIPEVKWLIASAVLEGFHNFNADWANRRVFVNPNEPKASVRVQIPELLTRFRREKGRILSIIRPLYTRPLVTGDPEIWRANRQASGAVGYIYHNTGFPVIADSWISDILMEGTAGILPFWDEDMTYEGEMTGEVNFRVVPAWQLFPFPSTAINDSEMEGIIWSRVVSEEWIRKNIPEAIDESKKSITTPYHALEGFTQSGAMTVAFEGYEVRYGFFKPSRRFPQGEMVIMVGNKVYRRKGALNFFIGKQRVLPICIARYTQKNTSWWGESFGYPVSRLNREVNRMMSLLVRKALMKAHPGYLMVPVGSVMRDDFKNQLGGLVPYRPSLVNSDVKPYWLTAPPGSPDTDVVINRFQGYMEETTSQHGPTRGTSSGSGRESNQAIQSLIRQDMIPMEGAIRAIDNAVQRAFSIAVEIARVRWDAPRQSAVTGPVGGPPASIQVDPEKLPGMDKIVVVTGLDMPMDRASQVQFLTNMATAPFKGGQPLIENVEYRRGLIALGVSIPGVDLMSPDEESAWIENTMIYGDGEQPGQPPEPDGTTENLETHLQVHKRFASSPEVKIAASDQVRAAFSHHIRRTMEMLQGNPAPPEFDTELRDSEDAALTDSLEAGQVSPASMSAGNSKVDEMLAALTSSGRF